MAYAGGLLSDDTFAARLEVVLKSRLIDPIALTGDLHLRRTPRLWDDLCAALRKSFARFRKKPSFEPSRSALFALDWGGGNADLLIGRHHACDVVLDDDTVSRQHARLVFRDAKWIIQDLRSTNGTLVNGVRVGRCQLLPGDDLILGHTCLRID